MLILNQLSLYPLFLKMHLFIWKNHRERKRERECIHSLVHSPRQLQKSGLGQVKARSFFFWGSHVAAGAQTLGPVSAAFLRPWTRSWTEELWREPVPRWHAGISGRSLTDVCHFLQSRNHLRWRWMSTSSLQKPMQFWVSCDFVLFCFVLVVVFIIQHSIWE